MKKVIFVMLMMAGLVGTSMAQSPIEETKRVGQDEVPAVVLKAYESDIGPLQQSSGYWVLHFRKTNNEIQGRLVRKEVFTPVAYVYKSKANKTEARFTVDGKLESVKGTSVQGTHGEE